MNNKPTIPPTRIALHIDDGEVKKMDCPNYLRDSGVCALSGQTCELVLSFIEVGVNERIARDVCPVLQKLRQ